MSQQERLKKLTLHKRRETGHASPVFWSGGAEAPEEPDHPPVETLKS